MLAQVRHPNVVSVFDVCEHEGKFGLWIELVRGVTLEALLRSRGPMSAGEAALVGQNLCRALAAVHAAGLVHRDVKTANVMREVGGRLVLMDLGAGGYRRPEGRGSSREPHSTSHRKCAQAAKRRS
jgi:serine/threonine protein kinase